MYWEQNVHFHLVLLHESKRHPRATLIFNYRRTRQSVCNIRTCGSSVGGIAYLFMFVKCGAKSPGISTAENLQILSTVIAHFQSRFCLNVASYSPTRFTKRLPILADRTTVTQLPMIGYWHHTVVCLSVCLSLRL